MSARTSGQTAPTKVRRARTARPCWVVVAFATALSACQWVVPPDPNAGLGVTMKVVTPVVEQAVGRLQLVEDGLWAFVADDGARLADLSAGRVVASEDADGSQAHTFVVVATHPWGAYLQRLDSSPVTPSPEATLVPLTSLDAKVASRWGFCVDEGSPSDSACLADTAAGRRWNIYSLTDQDTLVVEGVSRRGVVESSPAMPVTRIGVVSVGPLGAVTVSAKGVSGRWFAAPGPVAARPTTVRIAVESGCAELPRGVADGVEWFEGAPPADDTLLAVENSAYALGADAFVSCSSSRRVFTPALFRPRVRAPGAPWDSPPIWGVRSAHLPADRETLIAFARASAAVATGDWWSADYWLEVLTTRPRGADLDRALLRGLQVAALAGRPESGARIGRYATRLEWNRENSPWWVHGTAAMQESLGRGREAAVRAADLDDTLERGDYPLWRTWMQYFGASRVLEHRDIQELGPELQGALLVEIGAQPEPAALAALAAVAPELAAAATSPRAARTCEDECLPDVYGASVSDRSDELSMLRVGASVLRARPEFSGLTSLPHLVAFAPLLSDSQRAELLVDLAGRASELVSGGQCPESGPAIARAREVAAEAALRLDAEEPTDAAILWIAAAGLPAGCEDMSTLVAAAAGAHDGASKAASQLVSARLATEPKGQLREALAEAAAFAAERAPGAECRTWNLALAVADALADAHASAASWTERAGRCGPDESRAVERTAAFLHFERTGVVSSDFHASVREELALLAHNTVPDSVGCVGLLDPGYSIETVVAPEVLELARSAAPPAGEESLELVSATKQVGHATEALADIVPALDAGDLRRAARNARAATEGFGRLGNQVGLARALFVENVVFGGKAADYAQLPPDSPPPKEARALLDRAKRQKAAAKNGELKVALSLLEGGADSLRSDGASALPETLCRAPNAPEEPRGEIQISPAPVQ